jgi:hypothetical protein
MLLQETGYSDLDCITLLETTFTKWKIYITHSHHFFGHYISDDEESFEIARDKILRIADKFCESEFQFLNRE